MNINEIFLNLELSNNGTTKIRKAIKCSDGFTMSVQASSMHYCAPRSDEGPWISFEVGFPSEREELIIRWAEYPDQPTDTVYGWVPSDVIDEVIAKHGGLE